MKRWSMFLLLGLFGLAGVVILLSMDGFGAALKIVVFGLLMLILPGLALTAVLFQGHTLRLPERLLIGVGLGLSLAGLTFLGLNAIRYETRAIPLLVGLVLAGSGMLTALLLVIGMQEQGRLAGFHLPSFSRYRVVLFGLAALVSLLALNLAQTPASPEGLSGYTLMWVQPAESPDWLLLGVSSEEFVPTAYRLAFESGGALRPGPTLELQPGETRKFSIEISGGLSEGQPFTILLYRLDQPDQAYRRVVWWPGADTLRKTSQ